MNPNHRYWKFAFYVLLAGWMLGAALNMMHFHGGFLTNYLADLAFCPWWYIFVRGLHREDGSKPRLLLVGDWFGTRGALLVVVTLAVGTASEFMTLYWPDGFIRGTFDPNDIAAYASGLVICYVIDKLSSNPPS